MGEEILKLVLDNCREQILNRCITLQKAVKEYKNHTFGPTWGEPDDTMRKDIEMFTELYPPSTLRETWSDYLDRFFMEELSISKFQDNSKRSTSVAGLRVCRYGKSCQFHKVAFSGEAAEKASRLQRRP